MILFPSLITCVAQGMIGKDYRYNSNILFPKPTDDEDDKIQERSNLV